MDEMASADDLACLARTPYKFYGGEEGKIIGTAEHTQACTIDFHRSADRYSRIDDMCSADARAILAQIP
jgi:hypothetical protein